jgi:hypothetical protein
MVIAISCPYSGGYPLFLIFEPINGSPHNAKRAYQRKASSRSYSKD